MLRRCELPFGVNEMRAVLLAGGLGTRLTEETSVKPKPMVDIGNKPILWHIMKIYSHHGINDFIICCGYKGYLIKEYFANYALHMSDVTFDMTSNEVHVHQKRAEPWKVTLVDTGETTMTGGRLKRVSDHLAPDEDFCLTYGDGLSDVNLSELLKYHRSHKKLATLTAVYPPGRFGALDIDNGKVKSFVEKPRGDGALINGGFFVLSPKVLSLIADDNTTWEQEPLSNLAAKGELMYYEHKGFWQPMDTVRDMYYLNNLWDKGKAPWKVWE